MKTNIINISPKESSQLLHKLSLKPGQIVRTQVIRIDGSQILLQFGSNILAAKTKVPLKTGERLRLVVESAHDGFIELKIVNDNDELNSNSMTSLKLGTTSQDKLEEVVRQLLKFSMPVNQETLMEINSLMKRHDLSDDMMQLIVWLKSIGVKVDSEKDVKVLEDLLMFFKGELSSNEETPFFEFLNQTENNILGAFNILGWPIGRHYIYLLTLGSKSDGTLKDGCKVVIKINSQSLGELWFKIELISKKLNADIICSNDQYKVILAKEVNLLCKALQTAGYQIKDIPIEVGNVKTVLDLIANSNPKIPHINIEI